MSTPPPPKRYVLDSIEVDRTVMADTIGALLHTILFCRAFGLTTTVEEAIESIDCAFVRVGDDGVSSKVSQILSVVQSEGGAPPGSAPPTRSASSGGIAATLRGATAAAAPRNADGTTPPLRYHVEVVFAEMRARRGWFREAVELIPWEVWTWQVTARPPLETATLTDTLSATLPKTPPQSPRTTLPSSPSALSHQLLQHDSSTTPANQDLDRQQLASLSRAAADGAALRDRLELVLRGVNADRAHIPPVTDQSLLPFPASIHLLRAPGTRPIASVTVGGPEGTADATSAWSQLWSLVSPITQHSPMR